MSGRVLPAPPSWVGESREEEKKEIDHLPSPPLGPPFPPPPPPRPHPRHCCCCCWWWWRRDFNGRNCKLLPNHHLLFFLGENEVCLCLFSAVPYHHFSPFFSGLEQVDNKKSSSSREESHPAFFFFNMRQKCKKWVLGFFS